MGMFDTVKACCPHCFELVELQSKGGDCLLKEYDISSVPVSVAEYLDGDRRNWNSTCDHCGGRYVFRTLTPVNSVSGQLVPLVSDEED